MRGASIFRGGGCGCIKLPRVRVHKNYTSTIHDGRPGVVGECGCLALLGARSLGTASGNIIYGDFAGTDSAGPAGTRDIILNGGSNFTSRRSALFESSTTSDPLVDVDPGSSIEEAWRAAQEEVHTTDDNINTRAEEGEQPGEQPGEPPEDKPLRRRSEADLLSGEMKQRLQRSHLWPLTQVQMSCIRPVMFGQDVLARAPPGSGKTLAALVPLLDFFHSGGSHHHGAALWLTPSPELAQQTYQEALRVKHRHQQVVCVAPGSSVGGGFQANSNYLTNSNLTKKMNMNSTATTASFSSFEQKTSTGRGLSLHSLKLLLRQAHQLVIGTPGRVLQLLGEQAIVGRKVRTLVLDEADLLLSRQHAAEVQLVVQCVKTRGAQEALVEGLAAGSGGDHHRAERRREHSLGKFGEEFNKESDRAESSFGRSEVQIVQMSATHPAWLRDAMHKNIRAENLAEIGLDDDRKFFCFSEDPNDTDGKYASASTTSTSRENSSSSRKYPKLNKNSPPMLAPNIRHLVVPSTATRSRAQCRASAARGSQEFARVLAAVLERELLEFGEKHEDEGRGRRQAIVFVSSRMDAELLARHPLLRRMPQQKKKLWSSYGSSSSSSSELLYKNNTFLRCIPLHAGMTPPQRQRIVANFRAGIGENNVLICTDVAGRGLDLPLVSVVVHAPRVSFARTSSLNDRGVSFSPHPGMEDQFMAGLEDEEDNTMSLSSESEELRRRAKEEEEEFRVNGQQAASLFGEDVDPFINSAKKRDEKCSTWWMTTDKYVHRVGRIRNGGVSVLFAEAVDGGERRKQKDNFQAKKKALEAAAKKSKGGPKARAASARAAQKLLALKRGEGNNSFGGGESMKIINGEVCINTAEELDTIARRLGRQLSVKFAPYDLPSSSELRARAARDAAEEALLSVGLDAEGMRPLAERLLSNNNFEATSSNINISSNINDNMSSTSSSSTNLLQAHLLAHALSRLEQRSRRCEWASALSGRRNFAPLLFKDPRLEKVTSRPMLLKLLRTVLAQSSEASSLLGGRGGTSALSAGMTARRGRKQAFAGAWKRSAASRKPSREEEEAEMKLRRRIGRIALTEQGYAVDLSLDDIGRVSASAEIRNLGVGIVCNSALPPIIPANQENNHRIKVYQKKLRFAALSGRFAHTNNAGDSRKFGGSTSSGRRSETSSFFSASTRNRTAHSRVYGSRRRNSADSIHDFGEKKKRR